MKKTALILFLTILLLTSGCGKGSASDVSNDQIATGVAATLTAIAAESPAATDLSPSPQNNRPIWLDQPERVSGPILPTELYGLAYSKDSDWLVDQGITFSRCYSDSPICMPARATIMTGRHGFMNNLVGNSAHSRPMENFPTLVGEPKATDQEKGQKEHTLSRARIYE